MNRYTANTLPIDYYQEQEPQRSYRSPIGKLLSIGAAACSLISAYDLSPIHEDAAALDKRVDEIVKCETRIGENINDIQKVMNILHVSNNEIARQYLIDQLMSFKSLVHSWDGYGALPTSAKCASSAIRVMNSLSDQAIEEIEDFYPNPNGSVSFKWSNQLGEKLSLSVGANALSYYCIKKGVDVEMCDDIQITNESIDALNDTILSVMIANV